MNILRIIDIIVFIGLVVFTMYLFGGQKKHRNNSSNMRQLEITKEEIQRNAQSIQRLEALHEEALRLGKRKK